MAGFDTFEDNFNQQNFTEDDPAADFLAREQDELAGLEVDAYMNGETGAVIYDHDDFNDINEHQIMNGSEETHSVHQEHQPLPQVTKVREEPEKIKKWREEQKKRLEEKDAEEEVKKQELHNAAKKELEEWYKHHAEQIEKTKSQNREASKNAEKEYVMDRDADVPGQEWECIAKLCDFNPKSSKNTRDVSRMRSIILQLKQQPLVR